MFGKLLLRKFADPNVSETNVLLKSGNWSASEAGKGGRKETEFEAYFRLSPVAKGRVWFNFFS